MWIIKEDRRRGYYSGTQWSGPYRLIQWNDSQAKAKRFGSREEALTFRETILAGRVVRLVPRRKWACRCDAAKAVAKVESGGTVLMNALDAKTFAADLKRLLRIEEAARAWVDCDGTPGSIVRTNNALRAALEAK